VQRGAPTTRRVTASKNEAVGYLIRILTAGCDNPSRRPMEAWAAISKPQRPISQPLLTVGILTAL
jgi:hypothetical protein